MELWQRGARGGASAAQERLALPPSVHAALFVLLLPPFFHQPSLFSQGERRNKLCNFHPFFTPLSLQPRRSSWLPRVHGPSAAPPPPPSLSHLSFASPSLCPFKSLYSWSYTRLVLFFFSTLLSHSLFWKRQGAKRNDFGFPSG